MLNIKESIQNGTAIFALAGRLDTVTAPELETKIKNALPGLNKLTLDLANLDYVSSAGLRVFLSAYKAMKAQGEMKVCNVKEAVMEVFEITGLSDILTVE